MKTIKLRLLLGLFLGVSLAFAAGIESPTPTPKSTQAPKRNINSKSYLLWRASYYEQRINEESAAVSEHSKMLAGYQKEYDELDNEKQEWPSKTYKHPDRLFLMKNLKHIIIHCDVITKDSEALIENYQSEVKWYRARAAEATEP